MRKSIICSFCLKAFSSGIVRFKGEDYCSDCIKVIRGSDSWKGIDVDEFIGDLRGRRFNDNGDIIDID